MNERNIVAFLHSRFGTILMTVIAVVATVASFSSGNIDHIPGDSGMWILSASKWILNPIISMLVSLLTNIAIAFLLIIINKRYNVLRSTSCLFAGLYLIMLISQPTIIAQLHNGTMMCLVMTLATAILFSTFNRPYPRQPIFLIFLLLSVGSMTQYAYAFYIPLFLLGCAQMRIFGFKTFIAALLGCISPVWIMWGFGLISFSDMPIPHFSNLFEGISNQETLQLVVTTAFSLLLMLTMGVLNLMKVYNLNSHMRAFNGFISILTFATTILAIADFRNIATYLPLINCYTAFQTAHFFIANPFRRSYIAILSIIAIYISFYWWGTMI